jgi:hypothetical protein
MVYWMEFLFIINHPQGVYCYCSIGFVFNLLVSLATVVVFRWWRSTRFGRGKLKSALSHSLLAQLCLFNRVQELSANFWLFLKPVGPDHHIWQGSLSIHPYNKDQ